MNGKKLYRNTNEKMIAGVCAGIADYFNTDKTIIRLLFIVVSLMLGLGLGGVLAYLIAAIIIPDGSNAQPPFDGDGTNI